MGTKAVGKARGKGKPAVLVSPARRKATEQFLRNAQHTLRLRDWDIAVDWTKHCERDALAVIHECPDSKHATITLSEKFFEVPARDQRQALLHELMHCHVFPLQRLAEDTVAALTSKKDGARKVFDVAHSAAVERLVDALADVLVDITDSSTAPRCR